MQNLPIVRTEFANRMKRAMLDFAFCVDASEIGMTEWEWWFKFINWQIDRLKTQELEEWKNGIINTISSEGIKVTRISDRERIFQLVEQSRGSKSAILQEAEPIQSEIIPIQDDVR